MIEIFIKQMKHGLKEELHELKIPCPTNSSSRSEATTESMVVSPSTRSLENLACLEACYKCVEDYPLTSVSLSSN